MYILKVTYKDTNLKEDWFKGVKRVYREPKENTLTLIGVDNDALINVPYEDIKYYQVYKTEDNKDVVAGEATVLEAPIEKKIRAKKEATNA